MSDFVGKRIAVLGAGKMGTSLIHALIEKHGLPAEQIIATGRRQEVLNDLHDKTGVETSRRNLEAIQGADIVLLCVKPQVVHQVLDEVGSGLVPDQVLISIAAGISTAMVGRTSSLPTTTVETPSFETLATVDSRTAPRPSV